MTDMPLQQCWVTVRCEVLLGKDNGCVYVPTPGWYMVRARGSWLHLELLHLETYAPYELHKRLQVNPKLEGPTCLLLAAQGSQQVWDMFLDEQLCCLQVTLFEEVPQPPPKLQRRLFWARPGAPEAPGMGVLLGVVCEG